MYYAALSRSLVQPLGHLVLAIKNQYYNICCIHFYLRIRVYGHITCKILHHGMVAQWADQNSKKSWFSSL